MEESPKKHLLLDAYTLCSLWQRFLLARHLRDGDLARGKSSNKPKQASRSSVRNKVKLSYCELPLEVLMTDGG